MASSSDELHACAKIHWAFIHPASLERMFWTSDVYKEWTLRLDTWSVGFMLLNNGFWFALHTILPSIGGIQTAAYISAIFWIVLAIAQQWWMKHNSGQYHRWHSQILFWHRLLRLIIIILAVSWARNQVVNQSFRQYWSRNVSRVLPSSLVAFRSLFLSSLALPCLMHGYVVPLPFIHQLLVHLIYLYILMVYQLPAAVAMLDLEEHEPIYTNICNWLNTASMAVAEVVAGDSSLFFSGYQMCLNKSKPALIIFLMVFMGVFLPVYVSLRLERHAKQLFLFTLQRHSFPPFHATPQQPIATHPLGSSLQTEGAASAVDGSTAGEQETWPEQNDDVDWYPTGEDNDWEAPTLSPTLQDLLAVLGAVVLLWTGIIHTLDWVVSSYAPV